MRKAGGDSNEGNWTIVIMDESGIVKARDVITATEPKDMRWKNSYSDGGVKHGF